MANRKKALCAALFIVTASGCGATDATEADRLGTTSVPLSAATAEDRAALALRWAPIHHQDVDPTGTHSLTGASDYVTRVDYDGDWAGRNNWDNAGRFPLAAHAYYSVVETASHWFIVYMFFHPRDWTDVFLDQEHENDSEGALVVVARDGSTYGSVQAAVTVAHLDFFSFVPSGSPFGGNHESIDGTLSLGSWDGAAHPITAQQSKGHGLKAWPYYQIEGGDGVMYFPTLSTAEIPSTYNDRQVLYKLVDIFATGGLWSRRGDTALFASYGTFAGDTSGGCGAFPFTCSTNSANAPWGWDDHDDGPLRGELATDPAKLVQDYFAVPGGFGRAYSFNPYVGIGSI
jgi:hypothetical protein